MFELIPALVVPLSVGWSSNWVARRIHGGSDTEWRETLRSSTADSRLAPPAWVFGPVWTTLYVTLGVASWIVATGADDVEEDRGGRAQALAAYAWMLALNFAWSPLFFGLRRRGAALAVAVLLAAASWVVTGRFREVDAVAGALAVPNAGWTTFAVLLNGVAVCA